MCRLHKTIAKGSTAKMAKLLQNYNKEKSIQTKEKAESTIQLKFMRSQRNTLNFKQLNG